MNPKTLRTYYGAASVALFAILIILAGAEGFWRNTAGDFFVVLLLYTLARTVRPTGLRILPLLLLGFAISVEILQYVNITGLLGIENENVQIAVGSVFDWVDIAAYGLGSAVAALVDLLVKKRIQRNS